MTYSVYTQQCNFSTWLAHYVRLMYITDILWPKVGHNLLVLVFLFGPGSTNTFSNRTNLWSYWLLVTSHACRTSCCGCPVAIWHSWLSHSAFQICTVAHLPSTAAAGFQLLGSGRQGSEEFEFPTPGSLLEKYLHHNSATTLFFKSRNKNFSFLSNANRRFFFFKYTTVKWNQIKKEAEKECQDRKRLTLHAIQMPPCGFVLPDTKAWPIFLAARGTERGKEFFYSSGAIVFQRPLLSHCQPLFGTSCPVGHIQTLRVNIQGYCIHKKMQIHTLFETFLCLFRFFLTLTYKLIDTKCLF